MRPAPHAGADQDLPPRRNAIKNSERIRVPAANRAIGELARRFAVPGIIETHKGAPHRAAMDLERQRFAAAHIGHQAAHKYDTGSLALKHMVGDCLPVRRG